jgi:O-antigen ligase
MMALLPFRKLLVTLGSRLLVPAFTFLCILAIPSIAWLAENSTTILHFLGRDTNLTGRLPLWSVVMQEISSRPFFGFGYGAFWTTGEADQVRAAIGWNPPNAHNGFLEILLGVGLVGGAFVLFGLIRNLSLALRAARVGEDVSDSWPLFFLIFLLLYSITESSLLSANSILTVLFVANSYWVVRARFRVAETEEQESETEENYSAPESIGYAPLES